MVLPQCYRVIQIARIQMNKHIGLVAWSHTKLVCSELVCTLMAAYVFHRVLHMFEVGNIDILSSSLTNNGMVPARNFEIM